LVKPDTEILDYNTRWSGLNEKVLSGCSKSLRQVQSELLRLVNRDTLLVGHSLDSDFKSLKLIHRKVVDTSVVFPHKLGLPYKRALRNLMSEHLQKIIQEDGKS
jgi:RNA exonuclease 1